MVWVLIAVFICAIIFVAGRAHSRYLDRLETRQRAVMTIQLFNVTPDIVKDTEFTVDLTSEAIHNIPIESLESFIETLEPFFVRNESETCVRPPTADNRTFDHGLHLVPCEGELHEAYAETAAEVDLPSSQIATKKEADGKSNQRLRLLTRTWLCD
jgi:hypothetical protein